MPCSIACVVYSQVPVCAHIAWPIHYSKGEKGREREPSPSGSNLVSDPMGLQASGMHQGELKPSFFFFLFRRENLVRSYLFYTRSLLNCISDVSTMEPVWIPRCGYWSNALHICVSIRTQRRATIRTEGT